MYATEQYYQTKMATEYARGFDEGRALDWDSWVAYGVSRGWVSPPICDTHDGGYDYISEDQREELEEGGDPCITVLIVREDNEPRVDAS